MDKGLVYAIGASIVAHGLVLGFGGGLHTASTEAPRILEARLAPEPPPAHAPEPPRPQAARPAVPVSQPRQVSARPPQVVRHTAPVPHLMTDQRADVSAPAVVATSSPAPTPLASVMSPPAPAAASGSTGTPAGPSVNTGGAAYSPPGFGASYLHNPKPAYPMMARRRGLEGVVRLDVRVSAEGIPTAVKVRESSGHESLDEAALTAVWHWRFSPARRGGEPVEGAVVVPVRFNLEGDAAG